MAINCEVLSPNAQAIFKKLEPYFPLGPWKDAYWLEEGKVRDNGWFDLRLAADRNRLMEQKKSFLGYLVEGAASSFRNKTGSMEGFANEPFSPLTQAHAEILLLLNDLDFQIETLDLVEA